MIRAPHDNDYQDDKPGNRKNIRQKPGVLALLCFCHNADIYTIPGLD